jgi:lysophospholipase L1-like esterase
MAASLTRTSVDGPVAGQEAGAVSVEDVPQATGHGRGWVLLLASSVPLLFVGDTMWRIRRLRRVGARVEPLVHDVDLPGRFPPRTLVVIGDSAAAGHGLPTAEDALARLTARLLVDRDGRATAVRCGAIDGATTAMVGTDQVRLVARADVVLIGVGVNDALDPRRSVAGATTALDELLAAVRRTAGSDAQVVLMSCPDLGRAPGLPRVVRPWVGWRCRRLARAQADVARRHDVRLLPVPAGELAPDVFGPDGIHPGVLGHRRLATQVVALLSDAAASN